MIGPGKLQSLRRAPWLHTRTCTILTKTQAVQSHPQTTNPPDPFKGSATLTKNDGCTLRHTTYKTTTIFSWFIVIVFNTRETDVYYNSDFLSPGEKGEPEKAKMRQDSDASAIAERIAAFKSDPEKLREATEFIDQLIQQAKKEAEIKQKEKEKNKFESQDPTPGNLKRRLGRARGFVLRMFDALCNCTQTAAAAARTTARNNPFTKR